MGFGSSAPPPDPELEERRAAEKKRVEEMETNQGFRTMGKSGSIRM